MSAITVIGSVNLDFVATAASLPAPGETVTGATLARHPGGKGANQALAARRLGADVSLVARVGADGLADEALALLAAEGVDLEQCDTDATAATGVALIAVAAGGENQIIVAPGANAAFTPDHLTAPAAGALICQLELPLETVAAAVAQASGFVCLNLAPAAPLAPAALARADLIVVNETEAAFYGPALHDLPGLVAVTWGARGAGLFQGGRQLAAAAPPPVDAVDATGAGDAFVGALVVAFLEGQPHAAALAFACTAGALAATRPGAQPSLPTRAEVEACLETAR
ncbi:PfkB family carbohydrate kinase [Phenylobacterium sp. 58.2.17]|uniref:PfkB family carbohydrate kinase n=1 Tax=Phenylobacterium sp. 58.2.17 TaxID=2969306 RepID=UPI002264C5F6|nr:PfkB family carbohydrate kinase [Phenylobacterium sp. 58.2.17]MCX7585439.1 PfkB family carbohydrate kinase [Phenylobacterium sp. 58.2.17]